MPAIPPVASHEALVPPGVWALQGASAAFLAPQAWEELWGAGGTRTALHSGGEVNEAT